MHTRTSRRLYCVAALTLSTVLISPTQAHEMDGIDHAHLSDGVVQIIEPIPGGQSNPAVRPDNAVKGVAPKTPQPGGVASLLIQAGLIISAVVLLVVALRAGTAARGHRHKQTTDTPAHPSTPSHPG